MPEIVDFNIKLPSRAIIHIKEKSAYNNNYYKLKDYGDWFYGKCDILQQVCHEDENCYTYSLGYFENEEFKRMISWVTNVDIFE